MVFGTKIEKGKRRKEADVVTLLQRHLRTGVLQTVALISKLKVTLFAEYATVRRWRQPCSFQQLLAKISGCVFALSC